MQFGTVLLWSPGKRGDFVARAQAAEDLGFTFVGVGDSPTAYRDWGLGLGLLSAATRRVRIGATVSSPHGRHPVATASLLSATQELSEGRGFFGIGTGGSAATATGHGAARLSELRDYIITLRALLRGEPAEWQAVTLPGMSGAAPVPIYVSAYGPAAMRLAGEVGDGVIIAAGASPELIRGCRAQIAIGAAAAGRSIDDIETWVMARVAVRDSRTEALADVKANLASAGAFGLRSRTQLATVPNTLRNAVAELQRRYDPAHHVAWEGPNAELVDELGLTDYLASRFALVGTAAECRQQVAELQSEGVQGILVPAVDRDPEGILERFATAVMQRQ
jgi:5,10-methylenetetrahydromethanopterin reductase